MPRFLVSKASARFVALAWCIWGPFLQQPTLQDLLEVADVLNKAVTAVPSEALQESQYLKDMHQGLQLTESQLLKVAGKVHFRNIICVKNRFLASTGWCRKTQSAKNSIQTNMTLFSRFYQFLIKNSLMGSINYSLQIPTPDKEPNTVLDVQKVK